MPDLVIYYESTKSGTNEQLLVTEGEDQVEKEKRNFHVLSCCLTLRPLCVQLPNSFPHPVVWRFIMKASLHRHDSFINSLTDGDQLNLPSAPLSFLEVGGGAEITWFVRPVTHWPLVWASQKL